MAAPTATGPTARPSADPLAVHCLQEQRRVYRLCMIEWLDSVHEALGVSIATFAHAVVLLDRFMAVEYARTDAAAAAAATEPFACDSPGSGPALGSALGPATDVPVQDCELQLVAMSCLLIATKLVEDEPPAVFESLYRYAKVAGHSRYSWREVRTMERRVCRALAYRLAAPSAFGELRAVVLADHAAAQAADATADDPTRAAPQRSRRSSVASAASAADTADSEATEESSDSDCAAAREGLTAAEEAYVRRLWQAVEAVPRAARAQAEVASFFLQVFVYSDLTAGEAVSAHAMARAANAAARAALQAPDAPGAAAELEDDPDAGDVARLTAHALEVHARHYDGRSVLSGLGDLGHPLAGAPVKRWEHPTCLASKRRFADPRPLSAVDVSRRSWRAAERAQRPLYALHDAECAVGGEPREERAHREGAVSCIAEASEKGLGGEQAGPDPAEDAPGADAAAPGAAAHAAERRADSGGLETPPTKTHAPHGRGQRPARGSVGSGLRLTAQIARFLSRDSTSSLASLAPTVCGGADEAPGCQTPDTTGSSSVGSGQHTPRDATPAPNKLRAGSAKGCALRIPPSRAAAALGAM